MWRHNKINDDIVVVIGIPYPGFLIVLFGLMPEAIDRETQSDTRAGWYWAHRRHVWAAVQGAYVPFEN